ncbi:MAG: O-acetylhomoserine aminocarboxypropyltransferase [Rhodospirillales bacterium]|nr:O-acetylhomoserine aminocarboxypropyltransferase [Rhodospirillales bacterium]MDE0378785.1 O-acetylhomoserine aminocarboxypropyltransferase [Rhodospirillales bacterium]
MNEMQPLKAEAAEAAIQREYGIETIAVHAGARPDPVTGARSTPIYQTTSYAFDDADHAAELFNLQTFGYIYSRITNPTVAVLEERVAALENGRGAVAASTGHAAQFLVGATLLESGDEFISSNNLYGGSVTQFGLSFKKLGWHCHFVDMTEPENVEKAMTDKVKFIFCEGLANPGGIVLDLEALAEVAKRHGVPLIVDNTMASPYLCRPFDHGADLVVHSTTKFIGGHGNTMGGMVVESGRFDWWQNDKFPSMTKPDPAYHGLTFAETFGDFGFTMKMRAVALRDYGPCMAAQAAWNLLQGVETLPLRMERHCSNSLAVARYLEDHPKVSWVSYAGLESNPFYALAQKYLPRGAGAVFTFGLKGGYEAGLKVVDKVNMFSHLANIGDTRSLIIHPASTTHRQLTDEQKTNAGAGPDVVRLSVGIESIDDIIGDLDQALDQI